MRVPLVVLNDLHIRSSVLQKYDTSDLPAISKLTGISQDALQNDSGFKQEPMGVSGLTTRQREILARTRPGCLVERANLAFPRIAETIRACSPGLVALNGDFADVSRKFGRDVKWHSDVLGLLERFRTGLENRLAFTPGNSDVFHSETKPAEYEIAHRLNSSINDESIELFNVREDGSYAVKVDDCLVVSLNSLDVYNYLIKDGSSRDFLKDKLDSATGPVIVLVHHSPHQFTKTIDIDGSGVTFNSNPCQSWIIDELAVYSKKDSMPRPTMVASGHIHFEFDEVVDGVRIVVTKPSLSSVNDSGIYLGASVGLQDSLDGSSPDNFVVRDIRFQASESDVIY